MAEQIGEPDDLEIQVQQKLEEEPAMTWNKAIAEIAANVVDDRAGDQL